MAQWLKQNAGVKITVGPAVTDSDGVTAVTTAQTSAADAAELLPHDGSSGSVVALTTDNTFVKITGADGYYKLTLTSDNVSTLGMLEMLLSDADQFLPIRHNYMVVPANVYDAYFGSDKLQVHVTEMSTDVIGPTIIASDTITSDTFATDAITAEKIKTGAITAAAIATDAIGATQIASDAIGAEAIAADAIGASQLATDAIGPTQIASDAITAAAIATDAITASKIATDAITATKIASDAIINEAIATSAVDKISTQVNAEVVDVLNVDTFAEPSSVPAATTTIVNMVHWLFTLSRNKATQTDAKKVLRNDSDAASIGTATVSDDGTTFTRGEWA